LNTRLPLIALVLLAFVAVTGGSFYLMRRGAVSRPQADVPGKSPAFAARKPEIAIEDGKTIDFSTGMAVVKDSDEEKAALARAAKDLEEASHGVTFESPRAPSSAAGKKR
jgi:hypothetical protein